MLLRSIITEIVSAEDAALNQVRTLLLRNRWIAGAGGELIYEEERHEIELMMRSSGPSIKYGMSTEIDGQHDMVPLVLRRAVPSHDPVEVAMEIDRVANALSHTAHVLDEMQLGYEVHGKVDVDFEPNGRIDIECRYRTPDGYVMAAMLIDLKSGEIHATNMATGKRATIDISCFPEDLEAIGLGVPPRMFR